MDLGQNIYKPCHMTLVAHHPLNQIDPCQRLEHDYSTPIHMIPGMVGGKWWQEKFQGFTQDYIDKTRDRLSKDLEEIIIPGKY